MTLLISFFMMMLMVQVELPAPTGPHAVGTLSESVTDTTREELATENMDDCRELMITFWYPAVVQEDAEPNRYFPDNDEYVALITGPRAANPMGIKPEDVQEHLVPLRTHSFADAPVADAQEQYPVLIFSHGFGGSREQNSVQAEELASHGYVVVGIDHTYFAAATLFPDGRIAAYNPGVDRRATREEKDARLREIQTTWTADARFVADHLATIDDSANHPLHGKLDLDKLAIFGHSFGGSTATEVCAADVRFKAGINMDGFPYGQAPETGVPTPFLFMRAVREEPNPTMLAMSGATAEEYEAAFDQFDEKIRQVAASSPAGYVATIQGTRHFNFSDFPFLAHLSALAKFVVGDIDPSRNAELVNGLTKSFFDHYLLGEDNTFPIESHYEELTLEKVTNN